MVFSSLISNAHGIVHVRDHRHLSDIPHTFLTACSRGELVKLSRGGYARAADFAPLSAWDRHRMRIAAAVSDYGSAVVVGRSAALWHGLWTLDPRPRMVELHRPGARTRPRVSGLVRSYHTPVDERDTVVVRGLAVSNVERTIADLYRIHGPEHAFVALCHALGRGVVDKPRLHAWLSECPWRYQLPRMGELIDHARGDHLLPVSALLHAHIALRGVLRLKEVVGLELRFENLRTPVYVQASECPITIQVERSGAFCRVGTMPSPPPDALVLSAREVHEGTAYRRLLRAAGMLPGD